MRDLVSCLVPNHNPLLEMGIAICFKSTGSVARGSCSRGRVTARAPVPVPRNAFLAPWECIGEPGSARLVAKELNSAAPSISPQVVSLSMNHFP